jgi:hypothetical protein
LFIINEWGKKNIEEISSCYCALETVTYITYKDDLI